jgi:hypothetical protein
MSYESQTINQLLESAVHELRNIATVVARTASGELVERGPTCWADEGPQAVGEFMRAVLALRDGVVGPNLAPIEALAVDPWEHSDCYWNAEQNEWTRPPLVEITPDT